MARSHIEIKEQVEQVERGWEAVRTRSREDQHQLYQHKEYAAELVSKLSKRLTTMMNAYPITSPVPDIVAFQTEGLLHVPFSFHVEPPPYEGKGTSDAERRADKRELWSAHLHWKLDPDDDTVRGTIRFCPFCGRDLA